MKNNLTAQWSAGKNFRPKWYHKPRMNQRETLDCWNDWRTSRLKHETRESLKRKKKNYSRRWRGGRGEGSHGESSAGDACRSFEKPGGWEERSGRRRSWHVGGGARRRRGWCVRGTGWWQSGSKGRHVERHGRRPPRTRRRRRDR